MRRLVACIVVSLLCGACGGSTPLAPSPPPPKPSNPQPPAPPPSAILQSRPVELAFSNFQRPQGWTYSGEIQNIGTGCAVNVKGTITFRDDALLTLHTSEWSLDPARKVQPNETLSYTGCCLTEASAGEAETYLLHLTWENVSCQ